MALKELKELITKTGVFQSDPVCKDFVIHFEELLSLYRMRNDEKALASSEFWKKYEETTEKFWESFHRAALRLGINPDVIKANLENPAFFAPQMWEKMQSIRAEVQGKESGSLPKRPMRSNKKGNKVRV